MLQGELTGGSSLAERLKLAFAFERRRNRLDSRGAIGSGLVLAHEVRTLASSSMSSLTWMLSSERTADLMSRRRPPVGARAHQIVELRPDLVPRERPAGEPGLARHLVGVRLAALDVDRHPARSFALGSVQ